VTPGVRSPVRESRVGRTRSAPGECGGAGGRGACGGLAVGAAAAGSLVLASLALASLTPVAPASLAGACVPEAVAPPALAARAFAASAVVASPAGAWRAGAAAFASPVFGLAVRARTGSALPASGALSLLEVAAAAASGCSELGGAAPGDCPAAAPAFAGALTPSTFKA
jgi:hypothetical protein